ncbi:LysR family transcriptional regulator [Sorangium cellulosum]|uniref:Transcriptional regulator n=1 Tax=Sorangium cellulosum So0157-2 TaxID=1254432 RepID=S4XX10_SORCE|nr:LysR family transcriptional regulator [Sorangium cellulosum]AGP35143.1 transcriptional regulator [Sorangium cellulosum So0157-2]
MLNLDWLGAFVVFSEHLNFTRAARALHVSQPALHAQIGKLGEALGVTLYQRRGQRLELTADGRRVAAFGREVGERTRSFLDVLRHGESREPVVLCAGEGSYLYLLGEGIRAFTARAVAPLRLLTRDREATLDAVVAGEAHLGVAPLEGAPDGLAADRLTEVEQVLVVPEAHPLARKRRVHLRDLEGARLVVPGPGRPHRAALAQALLSAGVRWEPAVEANGWELMLHFVRLGVGIAVVNACCRLPRGLVARPLPELPRKVFYVVHRRGVDLQGGPAALRDALVAHGAAWQRKHARGAPAAPDVTPSAPARRR